MDDRCHTCQDGFCPECDRNYTVELEQLRKEMEEALTKYGRHINGCNPKGPPPLICTCGFLILKGDQHLITSKAIKDYNERDKKAAS